jgi:uncharacterized membrane protein YhaH (DUF805 family)
MAGKTLWGAVRRLTHGRARRRTFWQAFAVWLFAVAASLYILSIGGPFASALALAVVIPNLGFLTLVAVLRLHDRDEPGWLAPAYTILPPFFILLSAVLWARHFVAALDGSVPPPFPILPVLDTVLAVALLAWSLVELGIRPGTKGPNRYGPDPRDEDV